MQGRAPGWPPWGGARALLPWVEGAPTPRTLSDLNGRCGVKGELGEVTGGRWGGGTARRVMEEGGAEGGHARQQGADASSEGRAGAVTTELRKFQPTVDHTRDVRP